MLACANDTLGGSSLKMVPALTTYSANSLLWSRENQSADDLTFELILSMEKAHLYQFHSSVKQPVDAGDEEDEDDNVSWCPRSYSHSAKHPITDW